MQQENTTTQQMSVIQAKKLLKDFEDEIERVEFIKIGNVNRARRYNEMTSRVQFLKKPAQKIERSLRRLEATNRLIEQCIETLNQLNAQATQIRTQLMSA